MLEQHRPSGGIGGTVAVGVVGTAYQAVIHWLPYVMITWAMTVGFAFGTQAVVRRVVKQWHCRNLMAGMAIGLVGALAGVAVSHYVGFALEVQGLPPLVELVEFMRYRVESGWVIGSSSSSAQSQAAAGSGMSGWFVYTVWGIEATAVAAAGVWGGKVGASMPYCEECGKWADKVRGKFEVMSPGSAKIDLVRNAQHVDELVAEEGGGALGSALEYVVRTCPECGEVRTIEVKLRWMETARKGQVHVKRKTLHERIVLSEEDVEVVLGMAPGEVKT